GGKRKWKEERKKDVEDSIGLVHGGGIGDRGCNYPMTQHFSDLEARVQYLESSSSSSRNSDSTQVER
ncbi:hypothetical protein Tsubulata_014873, partial [Turnera subulata]